MYKTVFVDWDGTLSNSKFWERWSKDPKHQVKHDLIQKALFQDANDVIQGWMLGFYPTATVVKYVADNTGLPYQGLFDELRYSAEHMEFVSKDAVDMIQSIRIKGIKVAIATDNMDTFRHWTMPALNIQALFDGVLTSDTIGALKHQSGDDGKSLFFQHYMHQNNLKPGESVLIDNSTNNKVVENFGIDFLHVNGAASLEDHLRRLM